MVTKSRFTASVLHIIFLIFSLYISRLNYQPQSFVKDDKNRNKKKSTNFLFWFTKRRNVGTTNFSYLVKGCKWQTQSMLTASRNLTSQITIIRNKQNNIFQNSKQNKSLTTSTFNCSAKMPFFKSLINTKINSKIISRCLYNNQKYLAESLYLFWTNFVNQKQLF